MCGSENAFRPTAAFNRPVLLGCCGAARARSSTLFESPPAAAIAAVRLCCAGTTAGALRLGYSASTTEIGMSLLGACILHITDGKP